MIYENEYENCIHFDGKECRNELSCNYGSYGEFCVDCKDIEGDDNMKMNKIEYLLKNYEENKNKEYIEKICEILNENIIESPFNTFHYWDDIKINGHYISCIIEQRHGYDYALYPIDDNLNQRLKELIEKGVDNMKETNLKESDIMIEEIKNMMNNATDEQRLQIAQLHKNLTDGIVANTFIYDSEAKITESITKRLQKYTPSVIKINIYYNDAPYILYDDNDELRAHSWNNFIKILTEDIFTFYSTEMIKEEYYDNIKAIIDIEKQAIKQEIKFIKNVIEEINKISKETDDEIWDTGLIETTFEVYITLEKECKKILNELNINFNMSEYTPTESIPKAIELIEKEIL